jgi:hypothetical protein
MGHHGHPDPGVSAANNALLVLLTVIVLLVVLLYNLAVLVDAFDLIDIGLVVVAVAAIDAVTLTVYSLEPVIFAATVYIVVAISATNLVFTTKWGVFGQLPPEGGGLLMG